MEREEPSAGVAEAGAGAAETFAAEVFGTIAGRLIDRVETVALFAESDASFEPWCIWEGLAACRKAGWTVQPSPRYADVGVAGSRETADLMVFDPATGGRAIVELAVLHTWTTNNWVARLNGDTQKLLRAASAGGGIVPFQILAAAALASPIDVNPTWLSWLGMTIWKQPTPLRREARLGPVGRIVLRGWVVQP